MRRVVITGMGIVSSLGNSLDEVAESLREGRSGIAYQPAFAGIGMRSHVEGSIDLVPAEHIDRKLLRFMGDGVAYNYLAMEEAIRHAGLEAGDYRENPRCGLIMGSGGASLANVYHSADTAATRGARRVSPHMVPRCMSSTNSAVLATLFGVHGVNYSISSACATSAHCVGNAMEQIQLDRQDLVFAGGGEEVHWTLSVLFDAMKALSTAHNQTPEQASRPFDRDRDGFVISGGGGVVVVEALEHARARGAPILAEIAGYGATSDGHDMVLPSGEGAARCMMMALAGTDPAGVDYINAHGTSTPQGDAIELAAVRRVFGEECRAMISSTKSVTGHALGASGVHELICTLLMMQGGFVAGTANLEHRDPAAAGLVLPGAGCHPARIDTALSNSFGFGGTNASLLVRRPD